MPMIPRLLPLLAAALSLLACPSPRQPASGAPEGTSTAPTPPPVPEPPPVPRGLWRDAAPLPAGLAHPQATLLPNGRVFVFGDGDARHGALYEPEADTWTTTREAGTPRAYHGQSTLADGRVLLTGGTHIAKNYYVLRSAEVFDPTTGRWSKAGSMSARRTRHAQVSLPGGEVLAIGGVPGGFVDPIRGVDAFDAEANRWSDVLTLGRGRYDHRAVATGSRAILVAGGTGSDGSLGSLEVCEVGKERLCKLIPIAGKRERATLTALADGRALWVGGAGSRVAGPTELAFDPRAGKASPVAPSVYLRQGHSATLLQDGRLLVVGGASDAPHASAEVYLPSEDRWAEVARPRAARRGHTAVRLRGGAVMVLGGAGADDRPVATVEIFEP